jgi:hypothetical protein
MATLRIALTFSLLRVVWSEVAFSRSESSDVSYGNFYHHEDYKLSGVKINEIRVKSPVECLIRCMETNKCLSTNVNTTRDYKSLYVCELLASNKYKNQSNFRPSKGFDHYSIAVSLSLFCMLPFIRRGCLYMKRPLTLGLKLTSLDISSDCQTT